MMNPSNAWENFSNIYSSFSSAPFLSEKSRAGLLVNTVNHSLVLPQSLSPKTGTSKDFIYLRLCGESSPGVFKQNK